MYANIHLNLPRDISYRVFEGFNLLNTLCLQVTENESNSESNHNASNYTLHLQFRIEKSEPKVYSYFTCFSSSSQ